MLYNFTKIISYQFPKQTITDCSLRFQSKQTFFFFFLLFSVGALFILWVGCVSLIHPAIFVCLRIMSRYKPLHFFQLNQIKTTVLRQHKYRSENILNEHNYHILHFGCYPQVYGVPNMVIIKEFQCLEAGIER